MNNKKLILIIGGMIVAAIVLILIIKLIFGGGEIQGLSNLLDNSKIKTAAPLTTSVVPHAVNPDIKTWTGILKIDAIATLQVDKKIYNLRVSGKDVPTLLKSQGYQVGDAVNILGRLNGETIEMVGLNKLIK